jgi:hypothetical protein
VYTIHVTILVSLVAGPFSFVPVPSAASKLSVISLPRQRNFRRAIVLVRGYSLHQAVVIPFSCSQELQEINLTQDKDIWTYIWGAASFSVQKAYQALTGSLPTHPALKLLWKTKCQPKHRVFFWLLLQDKIPETNFGEGICT